VIVAATRGELHAAVAACEHVGVDRSPTLVPTMGALHEGHLRLLDEARSGPGTVVASIFVNPLQFGPGEDLARYPRTLEADLDLCRAHGVDVVFAPAVSEVYPQGEPRVTVDPGPLGATMEGSSRPGHFRGVLTVVAKLFGLVRPGRAVFGQKDYQQLVLVSRMADDLCLDVEIVGAETVRDHDGLALSSRNRRLTAAQRQSALGLSRALFAGRDAVSGGPDAVLAAAHRELAARTGLTVDYLELRTPDLSRTARYGRSRLLVAARVGETRLIDNVAIDLAARSSSSEPAETDPSERADRGLSSEPADPDSAEWPSGAGRSR
jgi:pantoate--beta-alanine ligase